VSFTEAETLQKTEAKQTPDSLPKNKSLRCKYLNVLCDDVVMQNFQVFGK